MATLNENIAQAVKDFDDIKDAIEYKGVDVPAGTPTSEYSEKIKEISDETPSGTISIATNGEYDVSAYANAEVNVPQFQPQGTFTITKNGVGIEIGRYKFVDVSVVPTENIDISSNGSYDVTNYGTAIVNVPQPSGSITIQHNGTVDVTDYETAEVMVTESKYMIERQLPTDQYGQRSMTVTAESVGDSAFRNFDELEAVYLTDSVTEIGPNAFSDCGSLLEATLGSTETIGDSAFENCSTLSSLSIPNSVTEIGNRTFANCDSITSLTIGSGITSIGADAFKMEGPYNSKHSNIYIVNLLAWLNIAFENLYANPIFLRNHHGGDVYIENEFVGNGYTLNIPEGITEIKDFAFYSFNIAHINFPSTLESIGESAFGKCRVLREVIIPEGVRRIESGAFSELEEIDSIVISSTVEYIADDAFSLSHNWSESYHSLSITVDANNSYYDNRDGCLVRTATNKLLFTPTGLNSIPSSVEIVSTHAASRRFSGSLVIPPSVNEIEDGAFANTVITSVDIPNTCRYVGKGAFSNCKLLTDISVAATYIDSAAFNGCKAENSLILSTDVEYVGEDSFNNLTYFPNTLNFASGCTMLESGCILISSSPPVNQGYRSFNVPENIQIIRKESIIFHPIPTQTGGNRRYNISIGQNVHYIEPGFLSIPYGTNGYKVEVYVTVSNSNTCYCSDGGSLYSVDKKHCFHKYGATNRSVVWLPQEVEVVEPYAFNNTLAQAIYLSTNCKILKTNSIKNFGGNGTSLYIYTSLKVIEPYAVIFSGRYDNVYYQGTEDEWKKIHIGEGNDSLLNATMHYQSSW